MVRNTCKMHPRIDKPIIPTLPSLPYSGWFIGLCFFVLISAGIFFGFLWNDVRALLKHSLSNVNQPNVNQRSFSIPFFPSLTNPLTGASLIHTAYDTFLTASGHSELLSSYQMITAACDQIENEILMYPYLFPQSQKKNRQTATTMRGIIHVAVCHSSLDLALTTIPVINSIFDTIFGLQRKSFVMIAKAPDIVRRRVREECIIRSLEIISEQGQSNRDQKKKFDEVYRSLRSLQASISADPLQCLSLPTVFLGNPDGVMTDLANQKLTWTLIEGLLRQDLGEALELFCASNDENTERDSLIPDANNNSQDGNRHNEEDSQSNPYDTNSDQPSGRQKPREKGAQGDSQGQGQIESSQGSQGNGDDAQSGTNRGGDQSSDHPLRGIFSDNGQMNKKLQTKGNNNISQWEQQLNDLAQTPPLLDTNNERAGGETKERNEFPAQWEGYVESIKRNQSERQQGVDLRLRTKQYGPYTEILNTFETFFGDTESFRERSHLRKNDDRSIFEEGGIQ